MEGNVESGWGNSDRIEIEEWAVFTLISISNQVCTIVKPKLLYNTNPSAINEITHVMGIKWLLRFVLDIAMLQTKGVAYGLGIS